MINIYWPLLGLASATALIAVGGYWVHRRAIMRAKAADALNRLVGPPVVSHDERRRQAKDYLRGIGSYEAANMIKTSTDPNPSPERHDTEWPNNFENK